jgi:hypothetical protein
MCSCKKVLLWKAAFSVPASGDFNYNLQFMPYGYRIFGAIGWEFGPTSSDLVVNIHQNGPSGIRGNDSLKASLDTTSFSGTVNRPGQFELLIPLVPYEDIEFNY